MGHKLTVEAPKEEYVVTQAAASPSVTHSSARISVFWLPRARKS
jgi:hypothetical protein